MYIDYIVYREDNSSIEHHGKSTTERYHLCFTCAAIAALNNETIESKIVEEEPPYCEDCSL